MRETTLMRWRVAQSTQEREAAWMFTHTLDSFDSVLHNTINEILKAETQS